MPMRALLMWMLVVSVVACAPVMEPASPDAWRPCTPRSCASGEVCGARHGHTETICAPTCTSDMDCPAMEGQPTRCVEGVCEAPCHSVPVYDCTGGATCLAYSLPATAQLPP